MKKKFILVKVTRTYYAERCINTYVVNGVRGVT